MHEAKKARLTTLEQDTEVDQLRNLARRYKYANNTDVVDVDLDQIRAKRERLSLRYKYGHTTSVGRSRGFSSAACLRGEGGEKLQAIVRDAIARKLISANPESLREYLVLTKGQTKCQ